MTPIHNAAKSTKMQDPLYIPPSEATKTNKSYSDMLLAMTKQNKFTVSELTPNTTIVLDESPDRSNQKENRYHKKSMETCRDGSVVILDEVNRMANSSLPEKNYGSFNYTVGTKRKRNIDGHKQILKKMKESFNKLGNYSTSITVDDDDDDVTEITDTASESGSLSNELIKNLGRSGISIHKVIKDNQNSGKT